MKNAGGCYSTRLFTPRTHMNILRHCYRNHKNTFQSYFL